MKKIIPIVGFGLLLIAVLLGASFLPKAVQSSSDSSDDSSRVQTRGRFAPQGSSEVGNGQSEITAVSVSEAQSSNGHVSLPEISDGGEKVMREVEPTPLPKVEELSQASTIESSDSIALDPFFSAVDSEDFVSARRFLEENREALDVQTIANLQTLVAVGETQKKQAEQSKAQALALEASQKKLELTLSRLESAESTGSKDVNSIPRATLITPDAHIVPFAFDSSVLEEAARVPILKVAENLHNQPLLRVDLVGMADSQGNPTYNRELSLRRAGVVAQILTNAGVAADRMSVKVGELAENGDSKAQRRVEIRYAVVGSASEGEVDQ